MVSLVLALILYVRIEQMNDLLCVSFVNIIKEYVIFLPWAVI